MLYLLIASEEEEALQVPTYLFFVKIVKIIKS